VLILALPLPSLAQPQGPSARDNCNAVTSAAVAGRDQANARIGSIETSVRDQTEAARNCLERFSDMAARQTMVIGGFDLAPLRDTLMDRACNIIQSAANNAQQSLLSSISSQLPAIPPGLNQVLQTPGLVPAQPDAGNSQPQSIWSRMTCSMNGTC